MHYVDKPKIILAFIVKNRSNIFCHNICHISLKRLNMSIENSIRVHDNTVNEPFLAQQKEQL